MAMWRSSYHIFEDETEDDDKIEIFSGPKEWQTVYKIIRELETTGESATHGRPVRTILKYVCDEEGGYDMIIESYKIIDGKIVWKTSQEWNWEEARNDRA